MPDVTYRQLNGRRARGLAGQKLVRRESAEHCLERLLGARRLVVVFFVVRKNNRRIIAGGLLERISSSQTAVWWLGEVG